MASPKDNEKVHQRVQSLCHAGWGRCGRHYTYPAIILLGMLLCSTFMSLHTNAASSGFRQLARGVRARFAAVLQQMQRRHLRTRVAENLSTTPLQRVGSASAPDLTTGSGSFPHPPPLAAEAKATGVSEPFASPLSGKEQLVLAAAKLRDVRGGVVESPLSPYVPIVEKLLFRYSSSETQAQFLELTRERYLGATAGSLWYIISADGKRYLLRAFCAPSPKGKSNIEQLKKAMKLGYEAALDILPRLPKNSSREELAANGISLPLMWGTVLTAPEIFDAGRMVCGRYAVLYPPTEITLAEVLDRVPISASMRMYLTREVLLTLAELHYHRLAHSSLSLTSFQISLDGKVYLTMDRYFLGGWLEDETSSSASAGSSLDFAEIAAASPHRPTVIVGAPAASGAVSRTHTVGWAVEEESLRQLPGTSVVQAVTLAGSNILLNGRQATLRSKKRESFESAEKVFVFDESMDSFQAGFVIYQIWCGVIEKHPTNQYTPRYKTQNLTRGLRPVSFRNCTGDPPPTIQDLVKSLQAIRRSQRISVTTAVRISPVFTKNDDPSSETEDFLSSAVRD